jgi:hypothetical protein
MTPEEIERQQVETVFLLGGGKLDDKPLTFVVDAEERMFLYHYDGAPDYADEFREKVLDSARWDVFTAVVEGEPPESIHVDGREFKREAFYLSSGERECPCRGCDEDPFAGVECPLCERTADEDMGRVASDHGHGFVYLGEGWGEAVYVCNKTEERRRVCQQHNINVWHGKRFRCVECGADAPDAGDIDHAPECPDGAECDENVGWFWQTCAPGCLPDSDVMGPFGDEIDALEDANDGLTDW